MADKPSIEIIDGVRARVKRGQEVVLPTLPDEESVSVMNKLFKKPQSSVDEVRLDDPRIISAQRQRQQEADELKERVAKAGEERVNSAKARLRGEKMGERTSRWVNTEDGQKKQQEIMNLLAEGENHCIDVWVYRNPLC